MLKKLGLVFIFIVLVIVNFAVSIFFFGNSMVNQIYIKDISLTDNSLKISGGTSSSADAYRKYKYKKHNNGVYLELVYVLASDFYRDDRFDFEIKDDFSNIDTVYLTDGKNIKPIWNRGTPELYIYKGNTSAEQIEIDDVVEVESNTFNINYLDIIKNKLIEKHFNGIDIEIVGIENDVLTIDLKDKEQAVVWYVNAGSSGSKIYSDIIKYSFLQPESNIKNWVKELKILINGEADVEGDHFNFIGTYNRNPQDKVLATIKDYGYIEKPRDYVDEYVVNKNAHQFVINPLDSETEIIISEAIFSGYDIYEGKELYRTKNSLLLTMELPEGVPVIVVKIRNGDRSSTWIPTYNGKDGTLIVPEEFKILN